MPFEQKQDFAGATIGTVDQGAAGVARWLVDASGVLLWVGGSVASGAADTLNPIKTGARYNAAGVSVSDGQLVDNQATVNGFQRVDLGTLIAGEDQTNNLLKIATVGGIMPTNTALTTYAVRLTTNTTTTPTSATAYISTIVISTEVGGTTSTVVIRDKSGTPLVLIAGFATTALSTAPTTLDFQTPVKMTSGIDIVTAGAAAATIDVWINYYQ